jgi:NAD(P)-dependent dehydrogenase (short-subunit alcohol dehydrogenase family)
MPSDQTLLAPSPMSESAEGSSLRELIPSLVAAAKSLAIEYASRGVRVNAVSLGVIKTAMHDESSYAGMGALHPIGRVGEVEDVVGGVLYLESAPFVTGEVLHIDGGQSAGH